MTTIVDTMFPRLILRKPIKVYKDLLLELETGRLVSMFQEFDYKVGEKYAVRLPMMSDKGDGWIIHDDARSISSNAIHSFADDGIVRERLRSYIRETHTSDFMMELLGTTLVTHECIIPEGSLYYRGSWGFVDSGFGAYASGRLIMGKEVARYTP